MRTYTIMMLRFSPPPSLDCERPGRVSAMMLLRLAAALVITFVLIAGALAADRPALKGDVVVSGDILSLGDLVEGITAEAAARPLFRAPALGQTGTIQARRIIEAARPLGLAIETGGRMQVVVTRATRRIGTPEIEAAVKRALETQQRVDGQALSINFDGPAPALLVAPDVQGQLTAEEVTYDRRSRRVSALLWIGPGPTERKAAVRVTGVAVEYIEVAVLNRPLGRGETAAAADFVFEKRVREGVPSDAQTELQTLAGRVARRALQAGAVVRSGDLARPEIVARGDVVTIVYEVPGMTLTLRGRASDAGAQGDIIAVVNPQSKKTLQAQIIAPGKVSVSAPLPGPVAVNTSSAQP
jgi:flagella basal body P-ring formation protein FlgA